MLSRQTLQGGALSVVIFAALCFVWHAKTRPEPPDPELAGMDAEYLELIGATAKGESNPMPGPLEVGSQLLWHVSLSDSAYESESELGSDSKLDSESELDSESSFFYNLLQKTNFFYTKGPNDKGIGLQLLSSLARVAQGYFLALLIAVPLGFVIGMSPLLSRALDPFIQILKPVSPLAWMPLALYTIKDSEPCAIFVILICAIWPILINTVFGVASVRKDYLNVAKTLEAGRLRTAFFVILPAAAPTILTGMRISIGIAWLVIVAAEMLIGGTGIGYFVWNEWNNLDITNVIVAIVFIGLIGMVLDRLLANLTQAVSYAE